MWDWLTALVWTCRLFALAALCLLVFSPTFDWGRPELTVPLAVVAIVVWLVAEIVRYVNRDKYTFRE